MSARDRYLPIKDYGIIGDSQTAALVSRHGSIDWLCLPQFDSPAILCRLLDAAKGGCFRIHPRGSLDVHRRYLDETAVLETTFRTSTGVLRLTDMFTVADRHTYISRLRPEHEILRVITGVEGEMEVEVFFKPTPDYARRRPRIQKRDGQGFFHTHTGHLLMLRADVPLALSEDRRAVSGTFTLQAGERRYASLAFDREGPAVMPILGAEADRRMQETIAYWRGWTANCNYEGSHRQHVVRSAITLKLLSYSESGAIVAAATTSLPEYLGGVRNWDYRYCWLRDASFTLRAFMELGFDDEADAFIAWLTFVTRRALPHVHILYNVHGGVNVEEQTLDHLEGYMESRPVRIGNEAREQFQLDIYGEVISACYEYAQRGGDLDPWQVRLLRMLGDNICRHWSEPDNGIWEDRVERQHHTYSKVMCWVGLDRLVRLRRDDLLAVDADRFVDVQRQIAERVETEGYDEAGGHYTSRFNDQSLDATLMLLALYGYVPADCPRIRNTYEAIREALGRGPLIYRYPPDGRDGLPPGEGAFGLCGYWSVEYLVRSGRVDEAEEEFTALLSYANDLGLFSEETDPETGAALGNFPQAFTHVGVINAALTLAEARGERPDVFVEEEGEIGRITS